MSSSAAQGLQAPPGPGGPKKANPLAKRRILAGTLAFACVALVTIVALSFATPALEKIENAPPPADWTVKMEKIGVSLVYYAARNGGKFPDKLSELLKQGYLKDLKAFDASDMPGAIANDEDIDLGSDFIYLLKGASISDEPQPALKQNSPECRTLRVSKKGLSWDKPSEKAPKT